jgi:hypothetical protein
MFCKECRAQLPDRSKFCSSCGIRQEYPNIINEPPKVDPKYKTEFIENVQKYKSNEKMSVDETPYTVETNFREHLNPAFFILLFPIVFFSFFIGKGIYDFVKVPKIESPQKSSAQLIDVTLDELVSAYRTNRVTADTKYKNNNLIITGRIVSIFQNPNRISFEVDIWNFPVDDFLQGGLLGSIYSLVMLLDKQNANIISNISPGYIVTVEGKFIGLNEFNNLQMNNCKIKSIE